ncbi:nicotinate mononucleotide-dependent phosphoribosyltransferase CobT [Methanobacterium alcaliphilum]|uniref:nicotinate mononucleotide-dependent phosphoribosyltransferase CobT n=1 Tax=Methanobacterium alcaliphilum TaxID=392018 RepID=UPI00200ADE6C|nr:TIGR00303 family protein [Methanobacterium alcaliphilum]MCK9151139.1 TIGR00303 family protein [Methanobacterium alcaliphilum]
MFDGLNIYGSDEFLKKVNGKNSLFLCTIATTATSRIEGITGAGVTPELTEYTPAADVELILLNKPVCLPEIPQTVVGGESAPTPAVITKAALELAEIPFMVADAGSLIKPNLPYVNINEKSGDDIRTGMAVENPEKIFENAKVLGKILSKITDHLVIGESTPAGTTTALGVLTALGYDASFKISGSMPENPHNLKKDVVREGIDSAGLKLGKITSDPFKAVEAVGDPMIPAVAGLVIGSDIPVTMAGGTQMTAVCALIKALKHDFDFSNVCIATTVFVAEDETSDINHIAEQIGDITIFAVDPSFQSSENGGLRCYLNGSVKEGVGAGGAMMAAMLQGVTTDEIRIKTEELCQKIF